MAESYEYSIGSVRAKEKELLSSADIEAMLACSDTKSLVNYLRDKGYAEGETVDELIKNNRNETADYISHIVPDVSVFDIFSIVNDAHNIKAVIKGLLADVDYENLIITPNTIKPEDIETAVKEKRYSLLPESFSAAAEKAYEVLAHTADARLADAYIDISCMKAQLKKAEETKIDFLIEYFRTDIFYRNVKTALRGSKTLADKEYFETALIDGLEGFDKKEIIKAALNSVDALCDYLALKDRYKSALAVEAYKSSPAAFERFCDNLLNSLAVEKCKRAGSGAEAALGFYIARLSEEKAIHIIAVGIETDSPAEITRERLRELYG